MLLYSWSLIEKSFSAAFATAGWSAVGTPSISMIVSIGSRAEQSATKSMSTELNSRACTEAAVTGSA